MRWNARDAMSSCVACHWIAEMRAGPLKVALHNSVFSTMGVANVSANPALTGDSAPCALTLSALPSSLRLAPSQHVTSLACREGNSTATALP